MLNCIQISLLLGRLKSCNVLPRIRERWGYASMPASITLPGKIKQEEVAQEVTLCICARLTESSINTGLYSFLSRIDFIQALPVSVCITSKQ